MNNLNTAITAIANEIYSYRYHEAVEMIPQLIEALESWQRSLDNSLQDQMGDINEVLGFVNQALEDRDYLRLADVLEFELMRSIGMMDGIGEVLQ